MGYYVLFYKWLEVTDVIKYSLYNANNYKAKKTLFQKTYKTVLKREGEYLLRKKNLKDKTKKCISVCEMMWNNVAESIPMSKPEVQFKKF